MMITRKALIAALALATETSGFITTSIPIATVRSSQLHYTSDSEIEVRYEALSRTSIQPVTTHDRDVELSTKIIMDNAEETSDSSGIDDSPDDVPKKLIMDIPPMPSAPTPKPDNKAAYTKVTTRKPITPKSQHQEGLLSPLVYAANTILGKSELNKLRAKIISYHSDIIKSFVSTSDSAFGKAVLKQLFILTDADNSNYLDKSEVRKTLGLLGFSWLKEKHLEKIFERADLNSDEEISLEEFMEEAPKTLKVNLVKLAKKNGDEMGLLV